MVICLKTKVIVRPGHILCSIQVEWARECLRVLVALSMCIWPRILLEGLWDGKSGVLRLICREVGQELMILIGLPLLGYGQGIVAAIADIAEALVPIVGSLAMILGKDPLLLVAITTCHSGVLWA